MFNLTQEKRSLLQWCTWFFSGHIILFWLVGLGYLSSISIPENKIDLLVFFSYLSHIALLALTPGVFILPFVFLMPFRKIIFVLSILFSTTVSSLMLMDVMVYKSYQYHLNPVVLKLAYDAVTKDIMGFSIIEKIIPLMIVAIFFIIEWFYANWLWKRLSMKTKAIGHLKWVVFYVIFLFSLSLTAAFYYLNQSMLQVYVNKIRFLPFYLEIFQKLSPKNLENTALIRIEGKNPLQWILKESSLNYPLQEIKYAPVKPQNLLVIIIDTWRYDMLNAEVMPSLFRFSQKSAVFNRHMSGGNATGPGVFSFFYGLPATYATAMESQNRGPVLINELLKRDYQMGIFSSAPLYSPPLDRTVFRMIDPLLLKEQPGSSVYERDKLITQKFINFVENRAKEKPFFSFIFYDAAHSYCSSDKNLGPFTPIIESCNRMAFDKQRDYLAYLNRYKNALFGIDLQINEVIAKLNSEQLLDNTVVVISGDHGEEFDDENKGHFGHASDFNYYQVQTPLVVYSPKQLPKQYHHMTSHFDIAPTLMTEFLGATNSPKDYSVGSSLFDTSVRPYLILSSYANFSVMEPDRITTIFSAGDYLIQSFNDDGGFKDLNHDTMQKVFQDLRRFFGSDIT